VDDKGGRDRVLQSECSAVFFVCIRTPYILACTVWVTERRRS